MHIDTDNPELVVLPGGGETPRMVLEEKWRVIGGAALFGAMAGLAIAHLLPAWYQSTARLAAIPVDDPTGNGGTSAVEHANAAVPMLAAIVHSRSVADEVVSALGLERVYQSGRDQARTALLAHMTVDSDRKANLVIVNVEDRVPARAQLIAETVIELAAKRSVQLWAARSHDQRLTLERELAQTQARLRTAEDRLREFRDQNHVIDLPAQISASVHQATLLEKERIDKEIALSYLRGFGSVQAIEVQQALRERSATVRALESLRHGPIADAPLLPLDQLPRLELEQARLKRDLDVEAARADLLVHEIGQLATAEARPGGRPELIDPPTLPRNRARPSGMLYAIEGATACALLVAGMVLARARRSKPRAEPA